MGRYKNNKDGTLDLIAGAGDTSALANKTDLTAIILTGTTNTSGSTITSGTWFYLNGVLVKAKVDIASGATFTLNTNYEEKTIGSALTELNSKLYSIADWTNISHCTSSNQYTCPSDGYFCIVLFGTDATKYVRGYINGTEMMNVFGNTLLGARISMFVRKGMRLYATTNDAQAATFALFKAITYA